MGCSHGGAGIITYGYVIVKQALLKSAYFPMAAFLLPVVLERSALSPMAVLSLPVLFSKERYKTDGRVGVAGAVVIERRITRGRVGATGGVVDKRERSVGRVGLQWCCLKARLHQWLCCRFHVCCVVKQCPCANSGVVVAGDVGSE